MGNGALRDLQPSRKIEERHADYQPTTYREKSCKVCLKEKSNTRWMLTCLFYTSFEEIYTKGP